jgi:hypothetical protein
MKEGHFYALSGVVYAGKGREGKRARKRRQAMGK